MKLAFGSAARDQNHGRMVRDFISKEREVMATSMKNLFLAVTAGLTMLVFLPEAEARGRIGTTMDRLRMTMAPNMRQGMGMQSRFTPPGSNGGVVIGTQPSLTLPGSNGGVVNPRFNRGRFDRFDRFDRFRRWWWPGGVGLELGLGGYGGLDVADPSLYAPLDGSQKSKSTSSRRIHHDQTTPTLTPEQERERIHQEELAWSRSDLPENETTSATALNILLADLQTLQARGIHGPEVKIDQAILPSLNVVVSGRNGNIGVLKHKGRINWPEPLSGTDFEEERKQIESSIPKAIEEATNAEAVDLQDLTSALASMRSRLAAKIKETPAPKYIRAKSLLDELDDAVKLLRQPDAANYFNQTYAAKGQTADQLVEYMTRYGLQFAPAVEGDEPAYVDLHQALAKYDLAANSQAGSKK
jgi:hypothetical protein